MKRKSLAQKINEVNKVASIGTYSLEEAEKHFEEYPGVYSKSELAERYASGKVLCYFKPYSKDSDMDTIYQINTFDKFIKHIAYYEVQLVN